MICKTDHIIEDGKYPVMPDVAVQGIFLDKTDVKCTEFLLHIIMNRERSGCYVQSNGRYDLFFLCQ